MALPLGLLAKLGGGSGGSGGGLLSKASGAIGSVGKAGLSLGTGLLQGIQAKGLKNRANAAMPDLVDPTQSAFLSELNQKRRSIDTGADFAAGMNAIDASNAGANESLVRSTGGDVGGTIQALLQSERVANDSKNNVLAQGQQQQMQYNSMYGDMLNRISDRRTQLQLAKSQQARAEWAKKQQFANQNIMAGLSTLANPTGSSNTPSPTGTGATQPMATPSSLLSAGQGVGGNNSILQKLGSLGSKKEVFGGVPEGTNPLPQNAVIPSFLQSNSGTLGGNMDLLKGAGMMDAKAAVFK